MIRGITFANQLTTSADFAHFINTFLAKNTGRTKGIDITHDDNNVYVSAGYFVTFGRYVNITGVETIPTEIVEVGTQYNRLVFTVDLSKTNTESEFEQGYWELLTSYDNYPALIQEDLDAGGTVYQIAFCKFTKSLSGVDHFVEELGTVNVGEIFNEMQSEINEQRQEFNDMFTEYRAAFVNFLYEQAQILEGYKTEYVEFFNQEKLVIEQMIHDLELEDFVTHAELESEIDRVQFGFENKTTVFNADGSIIETTPEYTKVTIFNPDGSITETKTSRLGEVKSKTTVFNADGSITETMNEEV